MEKRKVDDMKEKMKILGTEYDFKENTPLLKGLDADGICKKYSKEIIVRKAEDMLEDSDNMEEKEERYKEVCRHEAIHAFFGEAGIEQYEFDETLTQFLATNFPKMAKLFQEKEWLE